MSELRVAGTQDQVGVALDVELLAERGRDVDLGQDAESLGLEQLDDARPQLVDRLGPVDAEDVAWELGRHA